MTKLVDTLLLLALPASGKSEVRKYMDELTPEQCQEQFHIGHTVQLDDFPYVHFMRRLDDEQEAAGRPRVYFQADDRPFIDTVDWGTLIQLINEDYTDLCNGTAPAPGQAAAEHMFKRLDDARARAGAARVLDALDADARASLATAMEAEAAKMLQDLHDNLPETLEGKTIVIEFARGGPDGSEMPLPDCYGYQYSLAQLSDEILGRSAALYIWVTPEESRRKNDARADPDDPGSILHHGVPMAVMMGDYGCDDMDHLVATSAKPGTITVKAHGKQYMLPLGRFDNRVDKTSFIRDEVWKEEDKQALHAGLKLAMDQLAKNL